MHPEGEGDVGGAAVVQHGGQRVQCCCQAITARAYCKWHYCNAIGSHLQPRNRLTLASEDLISCAVQLHDTSNTGSECAACLFEIGASNCEPCLAKHSQDGCSSGAKAAVPQAIWAAPAAGRRQRSHHGQLQLQLEVQLPPMALQRRHVRREASLIVCKPSSVWAIGK